MSLALWVFAAGGVLMPLAVACAVLTARSPGSGGMYQWARSDFGPWHGFLCFWIYWIGIAFWFPGVVRKNFIRAARAVLVTFRNVRS
jgi:amino acid transporter